MPSTENKKYVILNRIMFVLGLVWVLLYGSACFYLYSKQAVNMEGQYFESDLPYHISMALDGWGYSITAWVYRILSFLPGMNTTIPIFLNFATLATIVGVFAYYRNRFAVEKDNSKFDLSTTLAVLGAFATTFAMPFFIRAIHYQRYIGYQSGSIWHNSTYIVMKPLALAAMLIYLAIANRYGKEKCVKEAVLFSVLLAIGTATKTSFIFVFAPAAFCFLILDLILGVNWKKVLLVALTVIPSLAVILWQEMVLFGEDTGNSIAIDFGYTVYLRAEKPYFTMILSALFPVCIFLFNIVPVIKNAIGDIKRRDGVLTNRDFLLSWAMWFFGALELLFLRETGNREQDANFSWGYDFCLFALFLISIRYFIMNLKDKKFLGGKLWAKILYGITMGGILFYHVYCGVYFFIELVKGTTYFM